MSKARLHCALCVAVTGEHAISASFVRTFVDPDEFHTALRNMVDGVVTGRGNFRAALTRIDLDRIWMTRGDMTLAQVLTLSARAERTMLFFAAHADQPAIHVAGMELSPGDAAVVTSGTVDHFRTSAAAQWGGISLPLSALADLGAALADRDVALPSYTHRIRPQAAAFARLQNLHRASANLAQTAPEILARPAVATAMDQSLTQAMIACLADGTAVPVHRARHHHARIMRRLEEILHAAAGQPIHLPELCRMTGASQRLLHACCRDYLGVSPIRYLWLRRMHLARLALHSAVPSAATVTDIATHYGFWEMGRFAVAYRALFGESPSAALRRPPAAQRDIQHDDPWGFAKSA